MGDPVPGPEEGLLAWLKEYITRGISKVALNICQEGPPKGAVIEGLTTCVWGWGALREKKRGTHLSGQLGDPTPTLGQGSRADPLWRVLG